MRLLIVKTSSLGDVVHTLPALTDAREVFPSLTVDWVVEESFVDVPAWHPAVENVIPVAVRRWRKAWVRSLRSGEIARFRDQLRAREYDLIIDAQGLLKSALISIQARGVRVGLDKHSSREPLASWFYQRRVAVQKNQHAVQRVRELFARALDYTFDSSAIDYGINLPASSIPGTGLSGTEPAIMFLHGTTWESKHWPLSYWQDLARIVTANGFQVLLPWGNLEEQQRAKDIAEVSAGSCRVLEKCGLTELASYMNQCQGVVAVDTGLGHLAAAQNLPAVSLYGSTNPALSGTFGYHQLHLKSDLPCAPCMKRHCHYRGESQVDTLSDGSNLVVEPACYRTHPPGAVWDHLCRLMMSEQGS